MTVLIRDLGTILGVWAHPDDEAYLSAGVMGSAVDDGSRVVCASATLGGLGGSEPERAAELEASLAAVGVTEHVWLGYLDGACGEVPEADAVARIAALIESVRPSTVLTFGPDGMTGHADHRAVSRWTRAAFERSAGLGARLLYATKTPDWAEEFAWVDAAFDVFLPGTPPRTPTGELELSLRLTGPLLARKVAALTAQPSQTAGIIATLGADSYAAWVADEWFRLGAVGAPPRSAAGRTVAAAGRAAPRHQP